MPRYEFTHIVTGAVQRHDLNLNGDVKLLLGDDDYGTYSVRRVEPEKLSDPVMVEIVDTSPATAPVITTLPDGTAEITARDGEITVTFTAPAIYAGTYTFNTIDFDGGPVNLVPPSISGTTEEGDILTAVPGLWIGDVARGTISITADWHRDGVETPGERQLTREIYPEDPGTSLTYVETAQVGLDERTAASNAIDVPALPVTGGVAPVVALDMTDRSNQRQDVPGTVAVTADGQPVMYFADTSGSGNDFAATRISASGNAISAPGHVLWNDAGFTPVSALTGLTDNMDLMIVMENTGDDQFILAGKLNDAAYGLGFVVTSNNPASQGSAAGSIITLNGVDIAPQTPTALLSAFPAETGKYVAGARSVDMTTDAALATNFALLAYTNGAYRTSAKVFGVYLFPALTDQQRADKVAELLA